MESCYRAEVCMSEYSSMSVSLILLFIYLFTKTRLTFQIAEVLPVEEFFFFFLIEAYLGLVDQGIVSIFCSFQL